MALSLPSSAVIKQYLPGLYFIGVAAFLAINNNNFWIGLLIAPFVAQMILNNKYLNLILGALMILWSGYMALATFIEVERSLQFILISLTVTVANLYMSRMMFLNQNFTMSALRENSLDETMFI